ncbi:MAG: hypothetical protein HYY84_03220 [Deltaproteobacteria bacterium]|nr:hypothetical protein [Deltaproteobacteria bacterium]
MVRTRYLLLAVFIASMTAARTSFAERGPFLGTKMTTTVWAPGDSVNYGTPDVPPSLGASLSAGFSLLPTRSGVAVRLDLNYSQIKVRSNSTSIDSCIPDLSGNGGTCGTTKPDVTTDLHTVDIIPTVEFTLRPARTSFFVFAEAGAGYQIGWGTSKSWEYDGPLGAMHSFAGRAAFGCGFSLQDRVDMSFTPLGVGLLIPLSKDLKDRIGSSLLSWQPAFALRYHF